MPCQPRRKMPSANMSLYCPTRMPLVMSKSPSKEREAPFFSVWVPWASVWLPMSIHVMPISIHVLSRSIYPYNTYKHPCAGHKHPCDGLWASLWYPGASNHVIPTSIHVMALSIFMMPTSTRQGNQCLLWVTVHIPPHIHKWQKVMTLETEVVLLNKIHILF